MPMHAMCPVHPSHLELLDPQQGTGQKRKRTTQGRFVQHAKTQNLQATTGCGWTREFVHQTLLVHACDTNTNPGRKKIYGCSPVRTDVPGGAPNGQEQNKEALQICPCRRVAPSTDGLCFLGDVCLTLKGLILQFFFFVRDFCCYHLFGFPSFLSLVLCGLLLIK